MSLELSTDQFSVLLRKFNGLVKNMPPKDTIASKLADIRQEAINTNELNYRQREAILARVDNYMNGTYGSWAKSPQTSYK